MYDETEAGLRRIAFTNTNPLPSQRFDEHLWDLVMVLGLQTRARISLKEDYRQITNKLQAKTLALELTEKDLETLKQFVLERFKLWLYHPDKQTVNILIEECKNIIENEGWKS